MLAQPDHATCGPTCLHAVYRYFGDPLPLGEVVTQVEPLSTGGTLAVQLACHALRRGYGATILTYNLVVFDPTWFSRPGVDLAERLRAQAAVKRDPRLREATTSYLRFLSLGGRIAHEELHPGLLQRHLAQGPVITGLSATYLYGCARERGLDELVEDDVAGVPTGHFVVLEGYDEAAREVHVADPYESSRYRVGIDRALGAILLGALTYDANLLVLRPVR